MRGYRIRQKIRIRKYPDDQGFSEFGSYFSLQGFRTMDYVYAQGRKKYNVSRED